MSHDVTARVRAGALAAGAVLLLAACGGDGGSDTSGALGEGDPEAGRELFATHCAACHGPQGEGTGTGPPLVHEIYEPSHHSDESFLIAVQRGVQPHHWNFGPMPAIPTLGADEVADIVAHVRRMQREAGIE